MIAHLNEAIVVQDLTCLSWKLHHTLGAGSACDPLCLGFRLFFAFTAAQHVILCLFPWFFLPKCRTGCLPVEFWWSDFCPARSISVPACQVPPESWSSPSNGTIPFPPSPLYVPSNLIIPHPHPLYIVNGPGVACSPAAPWRFPPACCRPHEAIKLMGMIIQPALHPWNGRATPVWSLSDGLGMQLTVVLQLFQALEPLFF